MVQTRRQKTAAASVEPTAENDASGSDSEIRVTHDAKLPAELFLAILKILADEKNLKTLLELTLGNKALAGFGGPILEAYPRVDVWLALQSTDSADEYWSLIVVGAFAEQIRAQQKLEHANDWIYDALPAAELRRLDFFARPNLFETGEGYEKFWIAKQPVVGKLDQGHVWLRTWEFTGFCSCGAGEGAIGMVEGVFASEAEARKGIEEESQDDGDEFKFDDFRCGDGRWIRKFKKVKVQGLEEQAE
jgi:hypothetical protein